MSAPTTRKRTSIQFGPALTALINSGQCAAPNLTARLEVLAGRYAALTSPAPPSWPVQSWVAAIDASKRIDLASPAAPWSLVGIVKQERLDPKLSYALDSMTPPQSFGVINIIERFAATGQDPTSENVAAFLEASGIAPSAA